jgi:hypothetical protein
MGGAFLAVYLWSRIAFNFTFGGIRFEFEDSSVGKSKAPDIPLDFDGEIEKGWKVAMSASSWGRFWN